MKQLTLLTFILLTLLSCEKDTESCILEQLEKHELTLFTGQDIGCALHLGLYDLNGEEYFAWGGHCFDMVFEPFDCAGIQLCKNNMHCQKMERLEYVGIIGFRK